MKSEKVKILHVCFGNFFIDNYSYQENILTKIHKSLGYEVVVFANLYNFDSNGKGFFDSKNRTYYNENNILVKRFNFSKIPFSKYLRIFDDFLKELRIFSPNIIFIHNPQFFDIIRVLFFYFQNRRTKIYIDNHADFINSATNWVSKNILHKIIWRIVTKIIEPVTLKFYGVTPSRCDFLNQIYKIDKKKIEFLPLGSENKVSKKKIRIFKTEIYQFNLLTKKDFVIISGGKIDERKKIIELIRVFKAIKGSNLKLILFGSVTNQISDVFFKEIKTDDRIKFVGWLTAEETYKYLFSANLGVFPGTHSILWEQAVGTGLPCIFKKWDGMTHLDVGGNCLFFNEIKELYDLIFFSIDKSNYLNLKYNSVSKAKAFFSYYGIAKKSIDHVSL